MPRKVAQVAEEVGSEVGVSLEQMPVFALTLAGWSASAIAAQLRKTERAVKDLRMRAAHRAGQTCLGPMAQRAQSLVIGETVQLLPADWRSKRKYLKRENSQRGRRVAVPSD